MKKSKQLAIQQNQGSYEQQYPNAQHQERANYIQAQGHKAKVSGLNQSMDAGMSNYASANVIPGNHVSNSNLRIPPDQYNQGYTNGSFEAPNQQQDNQGKTHYRSGSHAVGGPKNGKKSQQHFKNSEMIAQQNILGQTSSYGQGELSQAQMIAIQQQNSADAQNQRSLMSRGSQGPGNGDRIQQQKAKRKQNASKNFEYQGNLAHMGPPTSNTIGAPNQPSQVTINSKLQQNNFSIQQELSSKRSYENNNMEKKANRSSKQKFVNINPNQAQYPQNGNMYETARYNSISSLNNQGAVINNQNVQINHQTQPSKERFQGTQKLIKKSHKISGQGGSIILPASSGIQGAPQLKSQLSKNGAQKFYQQPLNHTIQSQQQFVTQAHQRGGSVQNPDSLGMNMQRGFNSASNAAIQQQSQIVQIYQQNPGTSSNTGSSSMNKMKYQGNQGNNSRKVIPILQQSQINQVVSHHKRAQQNVQQLSRDQQNNALAKQFQASQSKQLIDSYPNQNYQTFSQNYNSQGANQPLQGVPVRKSNDTSRASRLASREQSQRRGVVQGDFQNEQYLQNDLASSYNTSGNAIPQKKAGQRFNNKPNSSSIPNLSNQSSFNQTATQGFFPDGSTTVSNLQQMQDPHLGPQGHHQKNASQYTPQLAQSLKHTLNVNQGHQNSDGMILQPKKSGPIVSNSHLRQTSVQVADHASQNKKMSVQHRKNKSVLNNQIRINPALQNQQNGQQKLRASQDKQRTGQYYDNYTDQMQANYYMQQMQQTKGNSSLNLTQQTPHQLTNSNQNLTNASLKHNLSQSTHRKNKTTVMGNGQQKILGINSSSAFQQIPPSNLIGGSNHSSSAMKKIIGGTISHSHKSLRSQSSSRKRVQSVESSLALGQSSSHIQTNQSSHSKRAINNIPTGHMTPDLSAYPNPNSKHSQKAQAILKNQGGNMRQQLKPHGKIVIQQQPQANGNIEEISLHQNNLKSSQGNRRHSSILKGEHQNKQMIMIDQHNNVSSKQGHKNRIPQNPNQRRKFGQSPELGQEQDSMGSTSSMRAGNLVFQDGGTGGGNPNGKARKLSSQGRQEKLHPEKHSAFNTDKKRPTGNRLADSSDDYNSNDFQVRAGSNMGQMVSRPHMLETDNDIDDADLDIDIAPRDDKMANRGDCEKQVPSVSKKIGGRHQEILELDRVDAPSTNISKEALAIGKIPPEKVAELIANSGHSLVHTDRKLSPRTREMVEISNKIRKSFLQKGEAPKTTPDFYRAGKMLGRGAFGKVSMGMHKLSRKLVALKSINKEFMTDEKQKSKIMHEVGILLRLRHQGVVKLYETFETKRHMLLSMELCAGGDLLNYVRKRKKLDEDVAKVVFRQIMEGLGYIHKKRILHRDIKLDNILLDGNGNVKIADFGVSKLVKPGEVMHEQSGTPAYIAPEILREEGYMGFKADIWSAGVVLYAMLCGTVPFKAGNMKELHKMIIKGKYNLKEEVTDEAKGLLRSMLETDPKKRITVQKVLSHSWLQLPENPCDVFNEEERKVVKMEFIYNNPEQPIRSEKINLDEEPWDCFTELNLDSIDQALRNESEKSVILAPFNSSISDFDEEEWKGMEASLIIHRLFEDAAPLQDKKATVRFAARCRDQDRQYEINNNGELDNGVYHKFVYSSRDGQPDPSSSLDDAKGSINDLRPHSSRNMSKPSGGIEFGDELEKLKKVGRRGEVELSESKGAESTDSVHGIGLPGHGEMLDAERVQTLVDFGYPDDYIRYCLLENDACYCLAGYFLMGENQQY